MLPLVYRARMSLSSTQKQVFHRDFPSDSRSVGSCRAHSTILPEPISTLRIAMCYVAKIRRGSIVVTAHFLEKSLSKVAERAENGVCCIFNLPV